MEVNINEIKKRVQDIEEMYKFIQEIAGADYDALLDVFGMCQFEYIILENSVFELYDKWFQYKTEKRMSEEWESMAILFEGHCDEKI